MVAVRGAGSPVEELMGLNYLINGGFDFAQRTGGSVTTIADAEYGPDRWKSFTENASLQYTREDATGVSQLTSKYNGRWDKITSTGKFMVGQPIEGVNTVPLRGRTVRFQCMLKANAAITIRMAILELQNAGTMDTIPDDWVSAWNADTTDPTFGANIAIITGAESKSVTTTFQQFDVSVTVPSNSKNLMVAIWTDSQAATTVDVEMAEAMLLPSDVEREWVPRPTQKELSLCQRYYAKTYPVDVAPGSVDTQGCVGTSSNGTSATASTAALVQNWRYPVTMRGIPSIAIYQPATGAAGSWQDTASGGSVAGFGSYIGTSQCIIFNSAVTTGTRTHVCHAVAETEL